VSREPELAYFQAYSMLATLLNLHLFTVDGKVTPC